MKDTDQGDTVATTHRVTCIHVSCPYVEGYILRSVLDEPAGILIIGRRAKGIRLTRVVTHA